MITSANDPKRTCSTPLIGDAVTSTRRKALPSRLARRIPRNLSEPVIRRLAAFLIDRVGAGSDGHQDQEAACRGEILGKVVEQAAIGRDELRGPRAVFRSSFRQAGRQCDNPSRKLRETAGRILSHSAANTVILISLKSPPLGTTFPAASLQPIYKSRKRGITFSPKRRMERNVGSPLWNAGTRSSTPAPNRSAISRI